MKVKGAVIISIRKFVKERFPDKYENWLASLPETSKEILQSTKILDWYSLKDTLIIPTHSICQTFFGGDDKGAWEMGRFTAQFTLSGIYRIFVKVGSAGFILGRASRIMSAYYSPSEISVHNIEDHSAEVRIQKFELIDRYIEERIGGWIEAALEINGLHNVIVRVEQRLSSGDPITSYFLTWD